MNDGEEGEISAIGIVPKYRGKSIAKDAILTLNDWFYGMKYKRTRLSVASINNKAFELYTKLGFEQNKEKFSTWYQCEI